MQRTRETLLLAQSQREENAPCVQKMRNTSNPASPLPADVGNSPSVFVKYSYGTYSLDLPILSLWELHEPGTHSAPTESGFQSKAIGASAHLQTGIFQRPCNTFRKSLKTPPVPDPSSLSPSARHRRYRNSYQFWKMSIP